MTIEEFINEWFRENLNIGDEWAKLKQRTYIVTVPIKYGDISYCGGYICGDDGADASEVFWKYEEFCTEAYDYTERAPQCFWDNVWLINICLNSMLNRTSERICAGIKHDVEIPFDKLRIDFV